MEEIIREIINREIPLTIDVAVVKKLKGDVCHVESLTTKKDFFKCRLNAIETNDNDHLKITPTKGSTVVIGIFKGTEKAVVLAVSEADSLSFEKGETVFTIDKNGYNINRSGKNLKAVLNKLIDNQNKLNTKLQDLNKKVQAIIVIKGRGPDVPALTVLNTETQAIATNNNNEVRADLNTILIDL